MESTSDLLTKITVFVLAIAVLGTFIHLFLKSSKQEKNQTDATRH